MAISDNFYLEVIADIQSVFTDLGKTYQVRGIGAVNALEGTVTTTAERTVNGVVADSQFMSAMLGNTFGTNKKYLVFDYQSNPLSNEEVQVDGFWIPLVNIEEVKPADIVVAYMLDISK